MKLRIPRVCRYGPAAALALVALSVNPASAGAALAGGPGTTLAPCSSSALYIWMGLGIGTARQAYTVYPIQVSNLSGTSCTLQGYPSVTGLNNHTQLGSVAAHIGPGPGQLITLAPLGTAYAELRIYDPTVYGNCSPAPLTSLAVEPPGQKTKQLVPFNQRGRLGCRTATDPYLQDSTFSQGTGIPALLP